MYEQECRLVVDKAINAMRSTHLGVQFGAAVLLTFYSGARPSSLFQTNDYNTYLALGDLQITRAFVDGKMVGFDIEVSIRDFKGYLSGQGKLVVYSIQTIGNRGNMMLDFGCWIVSHLHRLKVWEDATPAEIWSDTRLKLTIPDHRVKEPVFRAGKPQGGGISDKPANAHLFNEQLKTMAALCDMVRPGATISWYCIRRGTATTLIEAVGVNKARAEDIRLLKFCNEHNSDDWMASKRLGPLNLDSDEWLRSKQFRQLQLKSDQRLDLYLLSREEYSRRLSVIRQLIKEERYRETDAAVQRLSIEAVLQNKEELAQVSPAHSEIIRRAFTVLESAEPIVSGVASLLTKRDQLQASEKKDLSLAANARPVTIRCAEPPVRLGEVLELNDDDEGHGDDAQEEDLSQLEEVGQLVSVSPYHPELIQIAMSSSPREMKKLARADSPKG
ncbi:hypothetical protein NliqN6_0160 [Naganishia liquefaciens]|uniref:Uncharacterized protein n=1 Tax=Naganishia liquefaciens TaxID=104408 RepID=A0A8H3TMI8_9TREE|nr:hypothetical protein NliqN6_0160 [Naganishia liquefaciens]